MKQSKKLLWFSLAGVVFLFGLGTFMHFLYALTGYQRWAAVIAPVNESVWEHTKMMVLPILLWGLVEFLALKPPLKPWLAATTLGLAAMYVVMIGVYYLYTGVLGYHVLWVDILIALLAAAAAQGVSYWVLREEKSFGMYNLLLWGLLALMLVMYFSFTINPPQLQLFEDPTNNTFGIIHTFVRM